MKESIINYSIDMLLKNGLRFSIDDVAKNLKISKKTIYKLFPTKETLAIEMYKTYYENALSEIERIYKTQPKDYATQMLYIYYRSHCMIRDEIFNKYAINESIRNLAHTNHSLLRTYIENLLSPTDKSAVMIIIDGALQKLYGNSNNEKEVIEKLVTLIC